MPVPSRNRRRLPTSTALLAAFWVISAGPVLTGCEQAAAPTGQARGLPDKSTSAPVDPYPEHPLEGLVTGTQLSIRHKPDRDSRKLGWLRKDSRVRLAATAVPGPRCATGWYALHPRGYVCAGQGIQTPPPSPPTDGTRTAGAGVGGGISTVAVESSEHQVAGTSAAGGPRANSGPSDATADAEESTGVLPYDYYYVKEYKVPEYFQLPSRDQQRAARDYATFWRKLERDEKPRRLEAFLAGKMARAPRSHPAVKRYLQRGFYVASTGVEVRSRRRFVRTVSGSYIKESQLQTREGAPFRGVELGPEHSLPVAWAIRTARPVVQIVAADGSTRWKKSEQHPAIDRLSLLDWKDRVKIGTHFMHLLEDGSYLRDWFATIARAHPRPRGVEKNEPWVHVDLGSQTLVLYQGDQPRFATLVSTGLPEHATPLGEFRIRAKRITATMANIGADAADDRYRIEDVPWTQYFSGSLALHGAFWHTRFGMQRSHGCVNLAPGDARRVFQGTWPDIPPAWHGVSTDRTGFEGSLVLITE